MNNYDGIVLEPKDVMKTLTTTAENYDGACEIIAETAIGQVKLKKNVNAETGNVTKNWYVNQSRMGQKDLKAALADIKEGGKGKGKDKDKKGKGKGKESGKDKGKDKDKGKESKKDKKAREKAEKAQAKADAKKAKKEKGKGKDKGKKGKGKKKK